MAVTDTASQTDINLKTQTKKLSDHICNPLSVYIHIPFCARKCTYCDFLSFPAQGHNGLFTIDGYMNALCTEISAKAADFSSYQIQTVYIGGGTPTIIDTNYIGQVLNLLSNKYNLAANMEITIEANPGTVTAESLRLLKSYGINRISFGLQSKNSRLLQTLGRIHDYKDFEDAFAAARESGFANINVDIMYALPSQTLAEWEHTLSMVISKSPEHISAYGLIIEDGTAIAEKIKSGELAEVSEQLYLNMYYAAKEILGAAGYEHYEISNFAKNGYRSRHNETYWRCMEYVGFGLGASSYIDAVRFRNEDDIGRYINRSVKQRMERFDAETVTGTDAMAEFMFMGLRMMDGVAVDEFRNRFNAGIEDVYGEQLGYLYKNGLIKRSGQGDCRISLTERGVDVSNRVFEYFLL